MNNVYVVKVPCRVCLVFYGPILLYVVERCRQESILFHVLDDLLRVMLRVLVIEYNRPLS